MTSTTGRKNPDKASDERGFTLIELIVVMGMLTAVFALSLPSLSRFFYGRILEEEARRFLSMVIYAQSQAISLGVPAELKLDVNSREYAVVFDMPSETDPNLPEKNTVVFRMDDRLRFDLDSLRRSGYKTNHILFLPDGTVEESSLPLVLIRDESDETIRIERIEYTQRYEILRENPNATGRR